MSDSDSSSVVSARSSTSVDPLSTPAVGLSSAKLLQGRRAMLELTNRLFNTGVQLHIDIPRIAVIGNQSAGKSSLIEAISGITLPRASGTCTRCPTECRLMNSHGPWKCMVSLRIMYDASGQLLPQPKIEFFGNPIYNKDEVEERIRRAQVAILNPRIPHSEILEGDGIIDHAGSSSFSANCIALEISGPDVADLSFCDLPGLIRSTRDGNSRDIELVERMVESYIKKPSCIILLTVSCETDHMNQGALHLAKKHDPLGERTVGVLTKPDRIDRGDENAWLGFIRGEEQPLHNHWFCVKQPSTSELQRGITWDEARKREDDFFSTTTPWSELDPMYQKYLRTSNLVDRLSIILSDLISKRLPEIRRELESAIQETKDALRQLPKAPSSDPLNEISTMLYDFKADIHHFVEGVPTRDGLHQTIRPFQEHFRKAIQRTRPHFVPYERSGDERDVPRPSFIEHEEEEEDVGDSESEAIYLEEVLQQANDARTRELPGNHPYVVEEFFIADITARWDDPTQRLCRETYDTILEKVVVVVEKNFAEFGQGTLERRISNIVQEHLRKRYEDTKERLQWLVKLETRPFTSNTHYFSDYRDRFLQFYKTARECDRNPRFLQMCLNQAQSVEVRDTLSHLIKLGLSQIGARDLPRLLPADEMEPALKIMAEVRAYFQVSYKRFADYVPLVIDYELIQGLERNLLEVLFEKLRVHSVDGPEICREFAQESSVIADRREELTTKLERLRVASQELTRM
ncbi:hypothetical protein L218DRAFT_964522 [Marasmius fiardii PR-910]|nr:hypothetical protein L218DRAFT_964522 [Marasmius fiardii PR-910]